VTADADEAAARERLGFNVLLSRAESGDSSIARSFAAREELVHFSKLLHAKRQEVTTLEARVLSLQVQVFELEEADEESKAKITGLERRSANLEVQLDRAKAEFRQQAKRFEEAEADLTGDVLDAYDEGFKDALAQVACVHIQEWILHPFPRRTWLKMGRSFPGSFLDLYWTDAQTLLSACYLYCPNSYILYFYMSNYFLILIIASVMVLGAKTFPLVFCRMFPSS